MKRTKGTSRFDALTDEIIEQRWKVLLPKAVRWSLRFAGLALVLFVGNRIFPLPQTVVNIINIGFQIACVFTVCGLFMVGMAYWFLKGKGKGLKSTL